MFTGIVQAMGTIVDLRDQPSGRRLTIDAADWRHRPAYGESIAVNGCCLTIGCDDAEHAQIGTDGPNANRLHFDIVPQTLSLTTLDELRPRDAVNLEHAATPTSLLGGHIVQGHIDGVGRVVDVTTTNDGGRRVRIELPESCREFAVERGSIAVDGVSLTVAGVGDEWVEVALIPTTLRETTLGALRPDQPVNLEMDYLARAAMTWLKRLRLSDR